MAWICRGSRVPNTATVSSTRPACATPFPRHGGILRPAVFAVARRAALSNTNPPRDGAAGGASERNRIADQRTRNRGDGAMGAHRRAVRKKRQRGSPASCAIRGKRRIQAIPPRGAIATETWSTPTVPASREHRCPPRQGATNRQDDPTGSAQAGSGNDYELG